MTHIPITNQFFLHMKCKFCKHYQFAGHRGGDCSRLSSTLVNGQENACHLYSSSFQDYFPSCPITLQLQP